MMTFASPAATTSRVASIPSIPGIWTSMSTTSAGPLGEHGQRLAPVRRLADDLDVVLDGEDHGEARADEGVVVDEQDADGFGQGSSF